VIGIFVQAQFQRLMDDLPARMSGLSSPLEAQLMSATADMNRAYTAAGRRNDSVATALTYIDRTITTIEWATIIGGLRTALIKTVQRAALEAAAQSAAKTLGKEATEQAIALARRRATRVFIATQGGVLSANIGASFVLPHIVDGLGIDHHAVAAGLLAVQMFSVIKGIRKDKAFESKREELPGLKKPPLKQAKADDEGRERFDADRQSHVLGAQGEKELAEALQRLPDQVVVEWGDRIGTHGADAITVNLRTGEVILWDSKYRSSPTKIKPSPTFQKPEPRNNAVQQAIDSIQENTVLPDRIKAIAIDNLEDRRFRTRTVGAGNAKNSTLE
jgi:hypothetical protein